MVSRNRMLYEFLHKSVLMAEEKIREEIELRRQSQPSSPEFGYIRYPSLLRVYQFISSECKTSSLFHPGLASEFPIDTLISAINAYLGCIYFQARE